MESINRSFNTLIYKPSITLEATVKIIGQSDLFEVVHVTASVAQIFHTLAVMKIDVVFLSDTISTKDLQTMKEAYPEVAIVVYCNSENQNVNTSLLNFATDVVTLPLQPACLQLIAFRVSKSLRIGASTPSYCDSVKVRDGGTTRIISTTKIKYIKSEGEYIKYFTDDTSYLTLGALKKVSSTLPANYVQVHRSYIVNTEYVTSISGHELTVLNGEKIPIGRTFLHEVRNLIL